MSHLLQMRGLKLKASSLFENPADVASFTDAWIETTRMEYALTIDASHLLQMRGLKLFLTISTRKNGMSHLLQMRGLKLPSA